MCIRDSGRSVWILDDITPLQQLTPEVQSQDAVLFDIRPAVAYLNDQQHGQQHGQQVGGQRHFVGENAPRGTYITYYLKAAPSGPSSDVKISIADATGKAIRTMDGTKQAGINRVLWNLGPNPSVAQGQGGGRGGPPPAVEPGTYLVTLTAAGKTLTKPVTVLQDRWLSER